MLGVCAAVIDIGTSWMFDLKEGICMNAFWLNREQCCWVANDTTFDQEGCAQVGVSVCCLPMFQKHGLFSEWVFSHAGPATWNALPDHICTVADLVKFRKLLKSHCFS